MPHSARNEYKIAFLDLDLVAAGCLFRAPFAGRNFVWGNECTSEH
jgi:hypothetical protein